MSPASLSTRATSAWLLDAHCAIARAAGPAEPPLRRAIASAAGRGPTRGTQRGKERDLHLAVAPEATP